MSYFVKSLRILCYFIFIYIIYCNLIYVGAIIIEDFAVLKRPFVHEFLDAVAKIADVYAYTAGTEGYAKPVFEHLDPQNKIFKKVLYRDSCVKIRGVCRSRLITLQSGQVQYLKDLSKFGNEIFLPSRTVLIDNNPISFHLQPNNGLLVPDFYGASHNDSTFNDTLKIIEHIHKLEDVRPLLTEIMQSRDI